MNLIQRSIITAWGAVLALGVAVAAVPPAEQLLPSDTLAVLGAPDWSKVEAARQQAPLWQMWNDPAMQPFRDKLMGKITNEFVAPLERQLGVKLADYGGLLQGQFTLAITRNGWNGGADPLPAFLLILDARDKSELLKTNLASVKQKLTDAGRKLRTEKIRDVEFTTLTLDLDELESSIGGAGLPGGAPAGAKPETKESASGTTAAGKSGSTIELSVGQVQSVLLAGTSVKELEKVLARLGGAGGGTLAEVPAYEADGRGVLREAQVYGWIHFAPLAEILTKLLGQLGPPGGGDADGGGLEFDKLMTALGLSNLKTLAFGARQTGEGEAMDLFMGVPEEARKGLFSLLATPAKDAGPPPFVPADAVQFSRWRADGQRMWTSVESMANDIMPGMLGFVLAQIEAVMHEKDPTFDFKKNVVGNLGDDYITYQKAPKGLKLTDLSSAPSLTLVASPNPDQLLQGLKSALLLVPSGGSGSTPKEREFLGRKIHSFPLPAMPTDDGSESGEQTLYLTTSGGYLAVSTDAGLVEDYLRSGETKPKPLSDVPGLSEASQKVGGTATGLFGYQNDAENFRLLFGVLRENADLFAKALAFSPLAPPSGDADKALKEWLDFSLLPPFEKVSKYLHLTVVGGQATKDGFLLRTFSPRPPQMKP